jgi:tetratricopeptide (TPR) repeat protein
MGDHFVRGSLLYSQRRFDLAAEELRLALAEDPQDARAHAILALCLSEQERFDDAQREAEEAIASSPDDPLGHYARAVVLIARRRFEEALAAAEEAIRLEPEDADHHCLHAQILFNLRRWPAALEAAERGLRVDGEHAGCTNFRAMALIKLGRRSEAGHTLEAALARNPEDALSHANQGWALVEQGDVPKALEHFKEALRLDPELEYARVGIVEALKARHSIYRWMLRYFLWMNRLSGKAQWAIVIGGLLGYNLLRNLADRSPGLAPFIWPILGVYIAFALLTWLARPFFDLLLRLNRFGRLALSREQVTASNAVGACLLAAAASAAAGLALDADVFLALAIFFGLLLLPVAGTFKCPAGWPRRIMTAYTALLIAAGVLFFVLAFLAGPLAIASAPALMNKLAMGFFAGIFLSQFVINGLLMVRVRR